MNARDLIEKLSPLEGHRIRIMDVDGNEHEQMCQSVEYLPPGQRDGNQGNVILRDGNITSSGAPAGFTMMAGSVLYILDFRYSIQITLKSEERVFIEVLE
jgi:hypothetical protein